MIELRNIFLSFRNATTEIEVIKGLSTYIKDGECVAVLGPSGCGKSTLLSLLAGYRKANRGTVVFNGVAVTGPSCERLVMFQQDALFPHLTVRENMFFARCALEWKRHSWFGRLIVAFLLSSSKTRSLTFRTIDPSSQKRFNEVLRDVGLSGFEDYFPKDLSGGMKKRAELARALVSETHVLMLDEPFGSLDAITREQMQDLLDRLWFQQHRTAVVVTHDWNEAVILADRVLVLSPRPATIVADIRIDLPRPRGKIVQRAEEFRKLAETVYDAVHTHATNGNTTEQ